MKVKHSLVILGLMLSQSTAVAAQQKLGTATLKSDGQFETTYCGHTISVLDGLGQKTRADELIIVIARLGDGERGQNLNHRRSHNVRAYLTQLYKHHPETIIVAEGERAKGFGRVELYVGGKLFDFLKLRRNSDLFVGTCYADSPSQDLCSLESEKNYYPCLDRRKQRSR